VNFIYNIEENSMRFSILHNNFRISHIMKLSNVRPVATHNDADVLILHMRSVTDNRLKNDKTRSHPTKEKLLPNNYVIVSVDFSRTRMLNNELPD
jgi:hypothetical protein